VEASHGSHNSHGFAFAVTDPALGDLHAATAVRNVEPRHHMAIHTHSTVPGKRSKLALGVRLSISGPAEHGRPCR